MSYLLDITIIIIIVLFGVWIKDFSGKSLSKKEVLILNSLWFYHLFIGVGFYYYVSTYGGDALNYWNTVKNNTEISLVDYFSMGFGTYFMYVLNYFPSKILNLSFFTGSLIYSLIGYIGFVFFYSVFKKRILYNSKILGVKLFPFLFFLPNLHFWTAGVGKDAILFFCIALFFYAIQDPKRNIIKLTLSLVLAYFTRPHIAAFLVFAFGVGLILDGNLKVYLKIIFSLLLVSLFLTFFEPVMDYLRIENFDLDTISNYSSDKVDKLSKGHTGSSVDISNYSLPIKMFTFLYRPLFFDINGILAVVASIENFILLLLTIRFIKLNPIKLFIKGDYFFKSINIFLALGVISFSLILGNLGIMLRQKNMFTPALLFICLWGFSYITQKKLEEDETKKT